MQNYILGYGSLMNAKSVERALKREVIPNEFIPARLTNFERTWSVKETVFSETLNNIINAVFLDTQPFVGKYLNAIIFAVSENELQLLAKREKNYNLTEVTKLTEVENNSFYDEQKKIYTFASKQDARVKDGETDIYILQKYVEMVEAACLEISKPFHQEFLETTPLMSFEVVSGKYTFANVEQAKYV